MSIAIPVVQSLAALPRLGTAVVAIGTFDGVHRGHRYLLTQACERAHAHGDAFVIVTFTPNPQIVLRPGLSHVQLIAAPIKVELLRALGPDCIALLPFTREMAATTADQFMGTLEERLSLREMWMGEDFAFGHKRSGNVSYLIARGQTSGFSVHVIPREGWHDGPVSSSRIRQALLAGDVALANDLLGYPLRLVGTLRTGGFPAGRAGLSVPIAQALPGAGSYDVTVAAPAHGAGSDPRKGILHVPPAPEPEEDGGSCLLVLSLPDGAPATAPDGETEVTLLGRRAAAGNG